jgi:hypothetical protein
MAVAFRLDALDRVFITLDWRGQYDGGQTISLRSRTTIFQLRDISPIKGGIATDDKVLYFERIIVHFREEHPQLDITDIGTGTILHSEPLTFHPSVFLPFFDYARSERFPPFTGAPYEKPEMLAVFTHAYNEDDMLTQWERHYSKLVGHRHLYVIDHGSLTQPRALLRDETRIVSIPRGAVDHANIAGFCHHFQRFLLTQYRWVIHVDSDEFIVHPGGPSAFLAKLATSATGTIIKPKNGYDLVHDHRHEPPIDGTRPVSLQRRFLKTSPGYAKPAIASTPTTWGLGFHFAFEQENIIEDESLWMIHLAFVDLNRNLARQKKWKHSAKTAVTATFVPESQRDDTVEELAITFDRMLLREGIEMPDWMRGMF